MGEGWCDELDWSAGSRESWLGNKTRRVHGRLEFVERKYAAGCDVIEVQLLGLSLIPRAGKPWAEPSWTFIDFDFWLSINVFEYLLIMIMIIDSFTMQSWSIWLEVSQWNLSAQIRACDVIQPPLTSSDFESMWKNLCNLYSQM